MATAPGMGGWGGSGVTLPAATYTSTPAAPASGGAGFGSIAGAIGGIASSVAGLFSSASSAYATQAQGYLQQAGYAAQAQENLRLSGLRADKEIEYANLAYERKLFQTQLSELNYKVQANSLLNNLRRTNSAARARAAAAGLDPGGGSALAVQEANIRATYDDVGITNLSALVSRVFGMEDATNILRAGYDNAFYTREAAIANSNSLLAAGGYATQSAGLLSTAKLTEGVVQFAKTIPTQF